MWLWDREWNCTVKRLHPSALRAPMQEPLTVPSPSPICLPVCLHMQRQMQFGCPFLRWETQRWREVPCLL